MAIIDNIRNLRGDGDDAGGKFNPFRLLEIGETMVRYCDGIRIKDYSFLAILTSERLVLIDSVKQHEGLIAKEIPISLIQSAEMEKDERDRPALAVTMEVSGQTRLMRMVFTGIISEPVTECREWFTAINGYPPEPEPLASPVPEPVAPVEAAPDPQGVRPEPVVQQIAETPRPVPTPEPVVEQVREEQTPKREEPKAVPAPTPSVPLSPHQSDSQRASIPAQSQAQHLAETITKSGERKALPQKKSREMSDGSIQICIEKPEIEPIYLSRRVSSPSAGTGKTRFCLHCGSRIPGISRFCPVCGKSQV